MGLNPRASTTFTNSFPFGGPTGATFSGVVDALGVGALVLSSFDVRTEMSSDNVEGEFFRGVSMPSVDNALGVSGGVFFVCRRPSVSFVSPRNEVKV